MNDTQELSTNPSCKCKYSSNLLSKILGRPGLRARTALPPVKLRTSRGPWAPQEAPRLPHDRPKTPKIGPKRPQDRPKIVLRRPRSAPDRPKRPQDPPKMRQDRPKMPPRPGPRAVKRAPGTILGSSCAILEPSWDQKCVFLLMFSHTFCKSGLSPQHRFRRHLGTQ